MVVGTTRLGVTTQQTVETELHAELVLLTLKKELPLQLILQALDRRTEGVLDELDGLMLDVAEGCVRQLRDHVRGDVDDAAYILDAQSLRLDQGSRDRIHGELLVLDTVLQQRRVEVARAVPEMLHERPVGIIVHVALRLEDGLDVSSFLIELRGEFLGGKRLAQGKRVVDDRIDALDAVQRHEHEVQHIIVRIRPVHPGETRVGVGYLVPFASVDQGDPDDACGMHLMQRHRVSRSVALDDGIGIPPAVKPGVDAVPEIELVGVGIGADVDDLIGWMV